MSARPVASPLDEKPVFDHFEVARLDQDEKPVEDKLVKSRFDHLTVWQALWTFRRSTFYTFIVYTAYIVDGYEVSRRASCLLWLTPPQVTMSGSIIANRGFIQQFGAFDTKVAKYVISPTWGE